MLYISITVRHLISTEINVENRWFFHLFEVIEGGCGAPETPVEKWRKKCVISLISFTSLLLCVSGAPRPLRAGFRSPEKRKPSVLHVN